MPVVRCAVDGKSGFRWEPDGAHCYLFHDRETMVSALRAAHKEGNTVRKPLGAIRR